jgi:hypothetical protein
MSEEFRYIPDEMEIQWNGIKISSDWTSFEFSETAELKNKRAGGERRNSYNVAGIDGEWSLEIYDTAEQADEVYALLRAGKKGVITVLQRGNVVGRPIFSFPAVQEKLEKPFKYDDNATLKCSGKQDGDFSQDIGSKIVSQVG